MASSFDLEHISARKRFSYWRDMAAEFYVPVSVESDTPDTFRFWHNSRSLGGIWMGTSMLTQLKVGRTRAHISRSDSDAIKVVLPLSGAVGIRQNKQEALVRPGQFFLVDPSRPYEEEIVEDLTFIWLQLSRESFNPTVSNLEKATATGFGQEHPCARVTTDYLLSLSHVWDNIEGPNAEHVASHITNMLAVAICERIDSSDTRRTDLRSAQFERAKTYVAEHLKDPALGLEELATVLGVSPGTVRELFGQSGVQFARYVMEQRLGRCARDLLSPGLASRSVSDIAMSWGFRDDARFSRAFEDTFGVAPREYRATGGTDVPSTWTSVS